MPDVVSDVVAAVALLTAMAAVVVAWILWGRLKSAREQLTLVQHQALVETEKIERLGGQVASLKAVVETRVQKLQLSALERQVEVATTAFKLQDAPLQVPRVRGPARTAGTASSLRPTAAPEGQDLPGPVTRMRHWVTNQRTAVRRAFERENRSETDE